MNAVQSLEEVEGACEDEARLLALEERYCSHGDTVHYTDPPKLFSRCEGSYLFDAADRPYLDLQMWYSAVNFGYANPRLNAAAVKQLNTLPQVASQYLHREKIELATRIARHFEETIQEPGRVHFNVGGSQAVEDALKLVRNATGGKSRMFAFEGGYHGRTLAASAITSSYRYRRRFGHFGDRAHFVPFPYCFRCPYGKRRDDCDLYCVDQFARLFDSEYHATWDPKAAESEFAAFFVEVVQGTGGYVVPPDGYFQKLKGVLEARHILLVDDEIQMGLFRTGKLWAIEHFGVKPDVVVFGKALTNGLNPLSGIWARAELIDPIAFPPGSTHSTFSANPLGTAVALETLRMLDERDYECETTDKGAYFLRGLRELRGRHPQIGDVGGLGMALRMEMCESDGFTPNRTLVDRMVDIGLRGDIQLDGRSYGLVLDVGGYYKNVITLAPSLDISYPEIDLALELLERVLTRALQA